LRKLNLGFFSWDGLMSDVKESIRDILSLPSLVHLAFDCVSFPIPEYLWWKCGEERGDWLFEPQSLVDISALRTLRLSDIRHSEMDLLRILGTSLEHLIMEGMDTIFWPWPKSASPISYLLHMFMCDAPRRLCLHPESPHVVLGVRFMSFLVPQSLAFQPCDAESTTIRPLFPT
jgi:hypothetical protein